MNIDGLALSSYGRQVGPCCDYRDIYSLFRMMILFAIHRSSAVYLVVKEEMAALGTRYLLDRLLLGSY